jgi:transcriptional regulator with XRE-family HTH domain
LEAGGVRERLGAVLRDKRHGIQFSQDKLGRVTGVKQQMISKLERGVGDFDIGIWRGLRLLSDYLGISRLEAYHLAGLLDFPDEEDRDAIEAALLIRELPTRARADLLRDLREGRERG